MRITRSGLRRLIAEEAARLLAETKKSPHERVPGGHQMRMAAGFEDEPEEEDWDDHGTKMLHVLSLGHSLRFKVSDPGANIDDDAGDAVDVTDEILDEGGGSSPEGLLSWLEAHPEIGWVYDDDRHDSESDDYDDVETYKESLQYLIDVGEGRGGSGEGEEDPHYFSDEYEDPADDPNYFPTDYGDLDEGEGEGHTVDVYDMVSSMNPAFGPALKRALSKVITRAGKMPTFSGKKAAEKRAEWLADVAVDVNDMVEKLLANDPDAAAEWDEMGYTDAVDEYNSLLDAEIELLASQEDMTRDEREAEEERERRDFEDTERDLSHPSNFLQEGEDDDLGTGVETVTAATTRDAAMPTTATTQTGAHPARTTGTSTPTRTRTSRAATSTSGSTQILTTTTTTP